MKTTLVRWIAGLQIGSMLLTGCTPTQPFYLRDKGDLSDGFNRAFDGAKKTRPGGPRSPCSSGA